MPFLESAASAILPQNPACLKKSKKSRKKDKTVTIP
jgi:hypothetical protein